MAVTKLSPRATAAVDPAANVRGIVAMLIAQAIFVTSDMLIKLVAEVVPATQIMAVRGVMAIGVMIVVIGVTGEFGKMGRALRPLVLARAVTEAIVAALFIVALAHLTLGEITTILQATPLILTAFAAVLGQRVGWRRWMSVVVGFGGVVCVVQPDMNGISPYAGLALMVAVLVAVRDLINRRIDPATPVAIVSFATTVAVCLVGWIGAPLEAWREISLFHGLLLFGSAVLVTTATIFMVRAFRGVEVTVVSPFRYVAVIWAIALGFIVWRDVPNMLAVIGTLIIIASGLYIMHREALRRRETPIETEAAFD